MYVCFVCLAYRLATKAPWFYEYHGSVYIFRSYWSYIAVFYRQGILPIKAKARSEDNHLSFAMVQHVSQTFLTRIL